MREPPKAQARCQSAVRLGLPDRAAQPLARFESWATAARHPGADAVLHRCRALLAHHEAECAEPAHGPGGHVAVAVDQAGQVLVDGVIQARPGRFT
ncbi:hypothetical protein [Nonomuraea sp. NPDC049400]|uniref:hypothetical protein n=1 Tax=Nonomuraea sp. NPDC049400 TaxID=3364352 RepID=UPI00378A777A